MSQGSKVAADNFFVKIARDGVNHSSVEAAVRELSVPSLWNLERSQTVRARIPPYRLSKFQDALPDVALGEMLGWVFIDAEEQSLRPGELLVPGRRANP